MKTVLKICSKCGLYGGSTSLDAKIHKDCGGTLIETGIYTDELLIIRKISPDNAFLDAMIDLKKKDIIEYNLKMSQFRTQIEQQKAQQSTNSVRCSKCGSTNIQMVPRKWSMVSGFMTNKTDRVCVKCKHKF